MYNSESSASRQELASKLINAFDRAGFHEDLHSYGSERAFIRQVEDGIFIKVFSSIVGSEVRVKDSDAIRVVGVYRYQDDGQMRERGLFKVSRVYRTGVTEEIVERTLERMRESWKKCRDVDRCRNCGTAMFITKKNNKACAALCWLEKEQPDNSNNVVCPNGHSDVQWCERQQFGIVIDGDKISRGSKVGGPVTEAWCRGCHCTYSPLDLRVKESDP